MSDENKTPKKKKRKKMTLAKGFKIFLVSIIIMGIIGGGLAAGSVISVLKDVPEMDPTNIHDTLSQTSSIYNQDGALIEKIQAEELRTIISINNIPEHLLEAFISIEDERYYEHPGVDPYGIGAAVLDNIRSDGTRGASTITQQLVRNLYLSSEVKISRKLKEAYLALQMEQVLTKDQILEAYLNRSYFGQNAYGIQEAALTYFSKDAADLTIAESAMLAGIVKSTVQFQPYYRVSPSDFDNTVHYEVGQVDVLGERMILVFNEEAVNRQRIVLSQMHTLGKISTSQYEEALNQDMKTSLKPFERQPHDISSYFTDYVKSQVVEALVDKLGYDRADAEDLLYTGGLSIYSTIDLDMQHQLEDIYDNFVEVIQGRPGIGGAPMLINWTLNNGGNIIDSNNNTVFFSRNNMLTEDYDLIISSGNFEESESGLRLNTSLFTPYPTHIDIGDYYIVNEENNLVTHTVGSLTVPDDQFTVEEDGTIVISQSYLEEHEDFYRVEEDTLYIPEEFFYVEKDGIIQPQSATVVMDYRTGQIKSVVGGRDVQGNRILNRATDSSRQPGSAIKPLSVYLPALDNGYHAGVGIVDEPIEINGYEPRNAYNDFWGLRSLRYSVEWSININAVKTLYDIGIGTSMTYLERMGIINAEYPHRDNFVSSEEDSRHHDEGLASLALGGMTRGMSPLEVTAAYGAIANEGVYVEPIAFTKILDSHGNVLLENTPEETTVVSPQIAYIMKDILRTTATSGLSRPAQFGSMAVAGKTGTTQRQADIWFAGFTPYYVSATWVGNDSPALVINEGSAAAARFWGRVNSTIHEGLEPISSFQRPEGITSASVCMVTGKLATNTCYSDPRNVVRNEIFASGTVPTQYCDNHSLIEICTESGLRATEYCPETEARAYVERDDSSDDSSLGNPPPTQYCDIHTEDRSIVDDIIDTLFPPEDENAGNGNDNGNNSGNGNGNGNDNNNGNGEETPPPGEETPPPGDEAPGDEGGDGIGEDNNGD